jgi:hypothetical protein
MALSFQLSALRACEEITLTAEAAETAERNSQEFSAISAGSAVEHRIFSQALSNVDPLKAES